MILAVDGGIASLGWAVVTPRWGALRDLGVIMQPRDPEFGEHEDRRRRTSKQASQLNTIATAYRCTTLVAEEMSFGGPPKARLKMAVSQGLCWGSLIALAAILGMKVIAIPPKLWQRAIVPEAGKTIDYAEVFARLGLFIGEQPSLRDVRGGDLNHAYDAVGIGVYASMREDCA